MMDGNVKNIRCVHVSPRQPDGMGWVWQDLIIVLWGPLFSSLAGGGGGHRIFSRAYISQPALQLCDQVTKFWPMGCKEWFVFPESS